MMRALQMLSALEAVPQPSMLAMLSERFRMLDTSGDGFVDGEVSID